MLSRRLFAAGAAGAPAILAGAAQAEDQPAESTIDRVKHGKVLRIAALPGEAPYFNKDIAGVFDGQVEYSNRPTAIPCSICRPTRSIWRFR